MNKQKAQVLSLAPLPQKFNWKLYQKIANSSFIKNEETAVIHFRKNAQLDSALRNKYFREHLNIPEEFDEELYIELLKNDYNIKMKSGSVSHEKLYMFYETQGKKKYPFNSTYYKKLYKIPDYFDETLYKSVYMHDEIVKNSNNIFKFYSENKTKYPLNDKYAEIFFNMKNELDTETYKRVYNLTQCKSVIDVYDFYKNNQKTHPLNDAYYKSIYKIPTHFDRELYFKRYPELQSIMGPLAIEHFYEKLRELLMKYVLDAEYMRISEYLNPSAASPSAASPSTENLSTASPSKANLSTASPSKANLSAANLSKASPSAANLSAASPSIASSNFSCQEPVLHILLPHTRDLAKYYSEECKKITNENTAKLIREASVQNIYILDNFIDTKYIVKDNFFITQFLKYKISLDAILEVYKKYDKENSPIHDKFSIYMQYLEKFTMDITSDHGKREFILLKDFYEDVLCHEEISDENYKGITIGKDIVEKMETNPRYIIHFAKKYNIIYELFYKKQEIDNTLRKYQDRIYNKEKIYAAHTNTLNIYFHVPDNKLYHSLIVKQNTLNIMKYTENSILNIHIISDTDNSICENLIVLGTNKITEKIDPENTYKKIILGTNYLITGRIDLKNYNIKNKIHNFSVQINEDLEVNNQPTFLKLIY